MKRLLKAAGALLCALGLALPASAQFTSITASHIYMGGVPIASGTVTFTPVSSLGQPIAFSQGGGGLNSPTAFSGTITAGAIVSGFQVPDACLTTPANILYQVQIRNSANSMSFTLQSVPNICGTAWALDDYAPPAQTSNIQVVQGSYGTAAPPASCNAPSTYTQGPSSVAKFFICVKPSGGGAGVFVQVTGSGGGVSLPSTTSILKGDGSGGAVAAAPGTDFATAAQVSAAQAAANAAVPGSYAVISSVASGITADYNFLQGSGSVLVDNSGSGNSGTLGSGALAPTWSATGLSFTGQQQVSLPAALNGSLTFFFGVYITPVTNTNQLSTGGNYPVLATSSTGASGLNLLYLQASGNNYVAGGAFVPSIFANNGVTTTAIGAISGFHVLAYVLGTGGGTDHFYLDGVEFASYNKQGSSGGIQTSGNLFLGSSNVAPFTTSGFGGTMYRVVTYPTNTLTASQIQRISGLITNDVASRGIEVTPQEISQINPTLNCIGDSITFGLGVTTPYCSLLSLASQPAYTITNWGVPGINLLTIVGSEPNRVAPLCSTIAGPSNALVFGGTNDFANSPNIPVQAVFSSLAAEIQILRKAGCRVFVGTMLSRTGSSGSSTFDQIKDGYAALILSQSKAAGADGIVDFSANPLLGADGASANATYFQSDGTHPTQAGHQLLANALSNSLNYYYGSTLANPRVYAASATLASGDRAVSIGSLSADIALVMPDCTGPSGEVYTISNPQGAHNVTIAGAANQPINGLTSAIAIPSNSTVTLRDVANPKAASGCHWAM